MVSVVLRHPRHTGRCPGRCGECGRPRSGLGCTGRQRGATALCASGFLPFGRDLEARHTALASLREAVLSIPRSLPRIEGRLWQDGLTGEARVLALPVSSTPA